jgi:peptidoglycan lytic transglycosylase
LVPTPRPFFFVALCVALLSGQAATSQTLSSSDFAAMRQALDAAHTGKWSLAYADLAAVKDPLPLKLLRWLDYTHGPATGSFTEIREFIRKNPGWPGQKVLLRAAEKPLSGVPDDVAQKWLARHPPVSTLGKVRAAELLLGSGDAAAGAAALRSVWINGNFGPNDEKAFLARHGALINAKDNVKRLDRLLWKGKREEALRMLPLVPPDWQALAEARLAFAEGAPNAQTLWARLPASLRSDPGLLYAELRWLRQKGMTDSAVTILLAEPMDPEHPNLWWKERRILARQVLASGNPALAYRLVEEHGPIHGEALSEAEFLGGYIALRFMKEPGLAFDHFARVLARATRPNGKARAGFWGGRAAEAEGKTRLAAKWFAAGAQDIGTFYGQLAAHQLGRDAPPDPAPEPQPSASDRLRFEGRERVRATEILFGLGKASLAKCFLLSLAKRAKTPLDFALLAALAEAHGRPDLAITVAARALAAGMPLMRHGYPVIALPSGGTAEHALLYAVIRQESAFETAAKSRSGALGLMQLMPATARAVAKRIGVRFSPAKLVSDANYNLRLGRHYLDRMLEDFGGSYALAIAAYNAGPSRVREWLGELGDPRGGNTDMVDWIEMLPYDETRHYVEHVLENLQIYRGQTDAQSAFSLVSDLAR